MYDAFSSFSNQKDGGTIIFGIDENAGYEVTGVYDAQDLQTQVKNAAEQMEPIVHPYFTVAEYEGKIIVRRNIKTAVIIDENGKRADKPEYPLVAVRELIFNALIHRDYSVHTEDSPIRVIIYRDRLVVENPGGLYGRLTLNDLGKVPGDTRNPFIENNLEVMIDTENRFSGIPTIREEMKNAMLPPPLFENARGNFRATLFLNKEAVTPNDNADITIEDKILHFCTEPKSKEEIAELLKIQTSYYVVTKYLKPLVSAGKLAMTIPEKPKSKYQKYFSVKE